MKTFTVIAVCAAIGTTAIAASTDEDQPVAAPNTALLSFSRDGPLSFYDRVSDEICSGHARGPSLPVAGGMFHSGPKSPIPTPAGERLFIKAHTKSAGRGGTERCFVLTSFIPEAGRTYRLGMENDGQSCALAVVDSQTGQSPATLIRHPWSRRCFPKL
ncbi:MAG TPA: hypothetical protein VG248_10660 [Caulobacteraceae bacterium]|jgi:hypothetical protein|nr:hypothetical protein [Caulobacteraceae bacterium]